jgi:hypothetical protein
MNLPLSTLCRTLSALLFLVVVAGGCLKDPNAAAPTTEQKKENIIGKMTNEIGEFKAEQNKEADLSIDASRPLHAMTAGAYKNILGQAAKLQITQAINLFHAEHGRYPKDYDEFMKQIVEPNQIQLPVLPGNVKYQYDVENHELVVVEGK